MTNKVGEVCFDNNIYEIADKINKIYRRPGDPL